MKKKIAIQYGGIMISTNVIDLIKKINEVTKMKRYIFKINGFLLFLLFSLFLTLNIANSDVPELQNVKITDLYYDAWDCKIVDDWKRPGLYAHVNLFDGEPSTCFAVETDNKEMVTDNIGLLITFNKSIHIDEIGIINGFAKNRKTFIENTRIKKLNLKFAELSQNSSADSSYSEDNILKDIDTIQHIKLKRDYYINTVTLSAHPGNNTISGREPGETQVFYAGAKYEDICISELEFYYKGNKVNIENSKQLKAGYPEKIQKKLMAAFSDMAYTWGDGGEQEVLINKNGVIKYERSAFGSQPPDYPDMWKVISSKLYLRTLGKWKLFEYKLTENGIVLYDPEYKSSSCTNGWLASWSFGRKLN